MISSEEIKVTVNSYGPGRPLSLVYVDPISGKKKAKSSGTTDWRTAERLAGELQRELEAGRKMEYGRYAPQVTLEQIQRHAKRTRKKASRLQRRLRVALARIEAERQAITNERSMFQVFKTAWCRTINPEVPECLAVVSGIRRMVFFELGSGIYFLLRNQVVVYVGQATCLSQRVGAHVLERAKVFDDVFCIDELPTSLDHSERKWIDLFLPEYNRDRVTLARKTATQANN